MKEDDQLAFCNLSTGANFLLCVIENRLILSNKEFSSESKILWKSFYRPVES